MYRQTIPSAVLALAVFACSAFSLDRNVFVTVRDSKSIPVSGLKAEHFRIFENGGQRVIKSVVAESEPMSIGFVFDASSSATTSFLKKDIDQVEASVDKFVRSLPTQSNYFLVGFNDSSATMTEWTSDPSAIARGMQQVRLLETKKAGPLFDVYIEAVKMVAAGKHRKRILVVFTDGRDGSSKRGRNHVLREVEQLNVGVYSVSLTDGMFGIVDSPEKNFLERLAWISGGEAHFLFSGATVKPAPGTIADPAKSEVWRMFERLSSQLSGQYLLTYETYIALLGQTVDVNVTLSRTDAIEKQKGDLAVRFRRKLGDSY